MRLLIVEDHEELATAVAAGLRREGMAVDTVLDAGTALQRAFVNSYDVVVLDRDLPDGGLAARQEVDLRALAGGVVSGLDRNGVRLESDLQLASATGDSRLLERLVANLVESALKYNREHGWEGVDERRRRALRAQGREQRAANRRGGGGRARPAIPAAEWQPRRRRSRRPATARSGPRALDRGGDRRRPRCSAIRPGARRGRTGRGGGLSAASCTLSRLIQAHATVQRSPGRAPGRARR